MRILGFSKKWDKLKNEEFTTFRFPRKDKDWFVGEVVQIFYKPRSKGGERLGTAKIRKQEGRQMLDWGALINLTEDEAKTDGFASPNDMEMWLVKTYGVRRLYAERMNKLTLRWVE